MRLQLRTILAAVVFSCAHMPMASAVDILSASGGNPGASTAFADNAAFSFMTKTDIIQPTGFIAPLSVSTGSSLVSYYIFDDSGSNTPGSTVMATGSATVSNTTIADITFTFNSANNLQPNTKYWYVFSKPNDGVIVSPKGGNLSTMTLTETYATFLGGSAKAQTSLSYPFSGWNTTLFPPNFVFSARITGSIVPAPEPSTYALGVIATGVMAAVARRRKQANKTA